MKSFVRLLFCLLFMLAAPFTSHAEEPGQYYDIYTGGGSGRITLVLDQTGSSSAKEAEWARSIDGSVRSGLDFAGLFNLLSAPQNLRDASGGINFQALNSIGAEVYSGGRVSKSSGQVTLDMTVYESVTGKLLMKRQYAGKEGDLKSIAYRYCEDLIELLTGRRPSFFGTKIVFVSNRTGSKEVYQCDFDGANVVQLTSSGSFAFNPALSNDGQFLAWTDFNGLYMRNLATKATTTVRKKGVVIDPAWRNGSGEIAATFSFEGDQNIYLLKPDGSIARRLTNSRGIDVSPTFSPDGGSMAFVSQRSGMPQLFVQELGSGSVRRITFQGSYNTQPSWSPAGGKIAYSSLQKNGEINIFTINADGSGVMQLTRGSRDNESPSWSPDGSMIVFMSTRLGRKQLFVMNADGSNQRPLLQMAGEQMQPSWSSTR